MALFKIFKGKKINLPTTYNEGYCYFTEDDGKFYIDTSSSASGRVALNAEHADSADTATKADSATYATNAGYATAAGTATKADEATVSSGLKSGSTLDSQEKIDNFITGNTLKYNIFKTSDSNNISMGSNDGMLISIPWSSNTYGSQIAIDDTTTPLIKIRGKSSTWGDWSTFLLSSNYTNYTVTKDGTGATGTWGINITGNASTATTANSANSAGTATSASQATKLTSSAGSLTNPVYFNNGIPVACTYSLNKTVPSNAVFTDTTYGLASSDSSGLMSKENYAKLVGIANNANKVTITPSYTSGTKIATVTTNDSSATQDIFIPVDKNDDYKVKSEAVSTNANYSILLNKNNTTGTTDSVYINSGIYVNPSTKTITATTFMGNASTATRATTAGSADTAAKLSSSAGSTTQPIYFSNGVPAACTYSLSKSVPSSAVFTDENVKQTAITTGTYPLLLAKSTSSGTGITYFDSGITLNSGTDTIAANISGNAATATKATTAGSADVVAWNNVSGKPDSFTPSAHDHERIKLKDATSVSYDLPYQSDFLVAYKQEVDVADIGLRTSFGFLFQDSSLRKQKFELSFFGLRKMRYFYSEEKNGEIIENDYTLATENDVEEYYNYAMEHADDVLQEHNRKENPHNITLSTFSVTATKDELNVLDGITATTQELNYTDGVTSNIQTQLNGKAASSHTHSNYASNVSVTGSGNAITAISQSGNTITATKGATFATLTNGKVPSSQLPSYVDDVIEGYYNGTDFYQDSSYTSSNKITPESGKIYINLNNQKIYRYGGTNSGYVVISETIALGETSATAYRGDKGKIAYDHSQSAHAPSNANYYVHPSYTSKSNGLYKITVDSLGHVSGTNTVTASDLPSHTHSTSNITALTGYSKPSSTSALSTSDSLNTALGKLEKAIDGKQASGSYAAANHTHSTYVNQNAFSNIKINSGTTPIAASSTTDTFNLIAGSNVTISNSGKNITISSTDTNTDTNTTYSAGTGISITGTSNTITNTGVRSISSGSTNGTISVNTNGTAANVAVKGLGSAAYTDSSAYQSVITGAASTVTGSNLTANRALVSNSSGKIAISSVTNTELSYLSGVTSAIQTQLDVKPGKIVGTVVEEGNTYVREIFNDLSNNTASGICSHAEGCNTTASRDYSHAEGYRTTASGICSHAEGDSTTASGGVSHAEGDSTTAFGYNSHAEGSNTTASGEYSHAEGYRTTASGNYSHAEGYRTTASGDYSHASGFYTIASGENSLAIGKYNVDNSNHIFSVGIGDSNTRKTAFSINTSGLVAVNNGMQFNSQNNSFYIEATGTDEVSFLSSTDKVNVLTCDLSLNEITLNNIQALNTNDSELIAAYNILLG